MTTTVEVESPYLTTEEAARYLRLGVSTLNQWRGKGQGPPFLRAGKKVMYLLADLDAWMESRREEPVGG